MSTFSRNMVKTSLDKDIKNIKFFFNFFYKPWSNWQTLSWFKIRFILWQNLKSLKYSSRCHDFFLVIILFNPNKEPLLFKRSLYLIYHVNIKDHIGNIFFMVLRTHEVTNLSLLIHKWDCIIELLLPNQSLFLQQVFL